MIFPFKLKLGEGHPGCAGGVPSGLITEVGTGLEWSPMALPLQGRMWGNNSQERGLFSLIVAPQAWTRYTEDMTEVKKPKKRTIGLPTKRIGRPSTYKPEYCEQIIKFFDRAPIDENGKACEFPTLEGFAASLKVHRDTINKWEHDYQPFADAVKKCKAIQYRILTENGMNNRYNTAFAIFMAKNLTDLRDQQHIDHTTAGEKIVPQVYLPQDLDESDFEKE